MKIKNSYIITPYHLKENRKSLDEEFSLRLEHKPLPYFILNGKKIK